MPEQWYAIIDGKTRGPLSSKQLQRLAREAKLNAESRVATGPTGPFVAASRVKGLFPSSPDDGSKAVAKGDNPLPPPSHALADLRRPTGPNDLGEKLIWSGRPSQFVNLPVFIYSGLVGIGSLVAVFAVDGVLTVPFLGLAVFSFGIALWKWLTIRCSSYVLTSERFRKARGVLSRRTDDLELYRVRDQGQRTSNLL